MPEIKIFYICNIPKIPLDDQQDVLLLGKVKKDFLDKYYECVFTYTNPEKPVKNEMKTYLRDIVKKFNFAENPLGTKENVKKLKAMKSKSGMCIGDVISVDKKYYAVGSKDFKEIV